MINEKYKFTIYDLALYLLLEDFSHNHTNNIIMDMFYSHNDLISDKYAKDFIKFKRMIFDKLFEYELDNNTYNEAEIIMKEVNERSPFENDESTDYFAGYFKQIKLQLMYSDISYRKIKLKKLLKDFGYRRRTPDLMDNINDALNSLELSTYLKNYKLCDIRNISLDDMIIIRNTINNNIPKEEVDHMEMTHTTRKVVFFNIAYMDYYKGIGFKGDEPKGGGAFVDINNDAHEACNFLPTGTITDEQLLEDEYCLGFVETGSRNGIKKQLRIENIRGCKNYANLDYVEDVLVIYTAKNPDSNKHFTTVVGWYKNAKVCRYYWQMEFDNGFIQDYNAYAKTEDCVLLPPKLREEKQWRVPRSKETGGRYGLGQSNVWYANKENNADQEAFLNRLLKQIDEYSGENLVKIVSD